MVKNILFGLLVLFVAIQFVRQPKNLGASSGPADFFARHPAPPEVKQLVQAACYDCHSNTTRYPWYAEVQPVGWYLADHVQDGKRHLNFSEFGQLTPKRAAHKLEKCAEEVGEGEMPLTSYRLIHREARLSEADRKLLTNWFNSVRAQLPPAEDAK